MESGIVEGSGVNPDPGLTVTQRGAGANMSVDISAGAALVNGTFYIDDATVNKAIAANASGNPRIDTIVLNKDWSAQTIRLAVVQGTPAGSPVPPSLVQSAGIQWQIPLADVAVANGAVSITNANITPRSIPANAPSCICLRGILNNSGVLLQTGDTVVWDTTADRAITTTTTAENPTVAGVWIGRTAIGGYGRMIVQGIGYVNANAAVTRGQDLATSTTAKQAAVFAAGATPSALGRALQTTGGAGLVLTYINTRQMGFAQYFLGGRTVGDATAALSNTTTSATFVDIGGGASITQTIHSSKIMVICTFMCSMPIATTYWDVLDSVSGARASGSAAGGVGWVNFINGTGSALPEVVTFAAVFTGLTVGVAHTFTGQWRVSAGTATMIGQMHMTLVEL